MFDVRFDFDYDAFQRTKVKTFHFSEALQGQIRDACALMSRAAALVAQSAPDPLRDRLVGIFFKTNSEVVHRNLLGQLAAMNQFIQDSGKMVTFVDGSKRQLRISMNPDDIEERPTFLNTPVSRREMSGVEAWVHPLPGGRRDHGSFHIGSGIRIPLGQAFHTNTSAAGRAGTIYHELTHKLLGTNDHVYGEAGCLGLSQAQAMRNADNYCHFLLNYIAQKPVN